MPKKSFLSSFIKFAAFSTAAMYAYNKFIDFQCSKNSSPDSNKGSIYSWKYGRIYYTKQGSGQPLLLIHELSHYGSGKEWDKLTEDLSSHHTVYVLDLLGCGKSDKPSVTYTNYMYVQQICDFIRDIIQGSTDIVISGRACPIALTALLNDCSSINKIIMINPPSVYESEMIPDANTRISKRIMELPIIGTFLYNILNSKANCFKKAVEDYFSKDDYTSCTYSFTMYDACHKNGCGSKYVMASIIGLYTNFPVRRALSSTSKDILIIGGSNEPDMEETLSSYRDIMPNISSTIIEGVKHFPQLENPKELYSVLEKHLQAV